MGARTIALLSLLVSSCAKAPPLIEPDLNEDVIRPKCRPPVRGTLPVALEPAFPNLAFSVPVDLVWAPHDATRSYVVEYGGTVRVIEDADATEAPILLDLSHHLERFTGEVGLWDIAFHPDYPTTPYLYAFWSGNGGSTDFRSVLTRYTTHDGGLTIDGTSEEVLLSIERMPGAFHGGGKIGFAADGLLWISTGDGDGYGDPLGRAQDRGSLLGKMLRIDVDAGAPYGIPPTNPFATGGGAPEIYALGFRNPWRWSFDRETGEVWLGDVGHHFVEEIDRVTRGGNYGWNIREASHCFVSNPCDGDFIDPVHEYGRDEGASVTGGYVYRGTRIAELAGLYIFGDYVSGRIWALRDDVRELVMASGLALAAFAEDPEGELLAADVHDGRFYRLVPADASVPGVPAPYLDATGCLDDARLVDYVVNTQLWSDGLAKQRRMILPEGQQAKVQPDGHWEFPDDTVLVKTFSHLDQPVETRLLIKQDGAWTGWSYQWFPSGTNAQRVDTGGIANLSDRAWQFPSTAECARCHTPAANHALGLHQAQLDVGTQLADLQALGVFDSVRADVLPMAALDDPGASLSRRARSYLHANCSMCHRPSGPAQGDLDLRYGVPLAETNACDRVPAFGTIGIVDGARVIAPGAPHRSVLLARMARRDEHQMPPLSSFLVDTAAVDVIGAWIASLASCASE